jgi:hypothetical protein
LIALPQMLYWTITTGLPLYDSYKKPPVSGSTSGRRTWGTPCSSFRKG